MYRGNARSALVEYERAAQIAGRDDSVQADRVRARALREAGDACNLELGEPARAAELYRELVQSQPSAPEALQARLHLVEILRVDLHDLPGAIAELAAAIARQPPQTAELRYELAKLYFQMGHYTQCALESDAVVQRYGTSSIAARAALLHAEALGMIEGRSSEAIQLLERLVDRFAGSELRPLALYQLGRMREEAGDLEDAIEHFVRALNTHPYPSVVQAAIARARKRLEASAGERVAAMIVANALFDGLSTLRQTDASER